MKYDPAKHHRRSIRLKGYDYSSPGFYFITICVQNRQCLFGEVVDEKIILGDAGKMVEKWYFELGNKYTNVKCREHIVMPNHFHFIIEIMVTDAHNGDAHEGTSLRGRPGDNTEKTPYGPDNKKSNSSLFDMMDWFKTMTTNEYIRGVKNKNWPRFQKRLWQLRYWDRIIRNENDYFRILSYIGDNPANWNNDKLND